MPMCNDISEIIGIEVENLKITQKLGLYVHKNVRCLLYKGILTYIPMGCECCGIKNDNHLIIKHGFRETKVYMGLILERPAYLQLKSNVFIVRNVVKHLRLKHLILSHVVEFPKMLN